MVVPVPGSSRYCSPRELKSPWKVSTLPVGVNAAWMDTSGQAWVGAQEPITLGLAVELSTVTVTVVAVVVFPAASRATAAIR